MLNFAESRNGIYTGTCLSGHAPFWGTTLSQKQSPFPLLLKAIKERPKKKKKEERKEKKKRLKEVKLLYHDHEYI